MLPGTADLDRPSIALAGRLRGERRRLARLRPFAGSAAPAPARSTLRNASPYGSASTRATILGRTLGHDPAAAARPFGPQIDDPVGRLDHIEVVLDHDHRVARAVNPWSTSSNLRTSSKCRPVVGSSRM